MSSNTKLKKHLAKSVLALAIGASMVSGAAMAAGNNTSGGLKGVVSVGEAQIAGATITVTNSKTGLTRTVTADENGAFVMSNLPVGTYDVTAVKDGYQVTKIAEIRVRLGSDTAIGIPMASEEMEQVVVVGSEITQMDTSAVESALNISADEVNRLPVAHTITDVALLAPGTVKGDGAFGNLASFGGASVAENTYFINGMNVTNFRNGLGGSTVPFQFYDAFQVKTGGYSAEFGRSTGGVVNAVTKSGSNEFEFGISSYMSPESLAATSPNTRYEDGTIYDVNEYNTWDDAEVNLYAAGPIIKDKLFFSAMYSPQQNTQGYASTGSPNRFNEREVDTDFWGVTLDWNIIDGHSMRVTAFSDAREIVTETFDYDYENDKKLESVGTATDERGGDNLIVNYTGQITDTFAVSAMWGENQYNLTSFSSNDVNCPIIVDLQFSKPDWDGVTPGCWVNSLVDQGEDTREAMRLDAEWFVGANHQLRFGIDQEINTSDAASFYSGGQYYRYLEVAPGSALANGAIVPDGVNYVVRTRQFSNGGMFETTSRAFYVEDTWDITSSLTAVLGLRNEYFNNQNSEGDSFIEVDNQWAPRLGLSWDVFGNGETRLFANYGRYHLPIANNTNVRLSGAESDVQRFFVDEGPRDSVTGAPINIDAELMPTSQELGSALVSADGTVPDTRSTLDTTLEPMYQDEFIIGAETFLNDDWLVGLKIVRRDLSSTIEDVLIDHAVASKYGASVHQYILTNPGSDVETYADLDGDGEVEPITLSAAEMEYPAAERYYNGAELSFERVWDGVWSLKGSYTWSQSYGNAEGYVKSDNGQDDAGILQDFDFPALMDGAKGYLPNDRRHQVKVFGAYQVTQDLRVGANFSLKSGRPVNAFGLGHPDYTTYDADGNPVPGSAPYGDTYYLWDSGSQEYTQVARGDMGRTDWVSQLDLNAVYVMPMASGELELRADAFNILNAASELESYEFAEQEVGVADPRYGLTTSYQRPFYVRLGAAYNF
ncbi:TonB-dependent receptor [Microbulbifer sediminum]|uniref:TonB-dependent receptor n=1 Tax=Microbulbifer sediminum TaxID=2904250 RepID=UPI001F3E3ACB|nr:TonB-dependent receptor [Microbulbifer sediminum]